MSNKMWGGRFSEHPDAIMEEINASIDFDRHLYRQDIAASKAHAAMLAKQGILTGQDAAAIAKGLDTILAEIEGGKFTFKRALEDIHMNVESRLAELIGPVAGRLHTARSRNDQVATDFRLYVRAMIDSIDEALVLSARVRREGVMHAATVMPGLPICRPRSRSRSGIISAYVEMAARSRRLRRALVQRKPARRCRACRHLVPDRSQHTARRSVLIVQWRTRSMQPRSRLRAETRGCINSYGAPALRRGDRIWCSPLTA
jgi:argininosuccinate lyase